MRRLPILLATLATLCPLAVVAKADAPFPESIVVDFCRRNCWPRPFDSGDRHLTRAPFVGMVCRGWELQNMIADHHFDEVTGQLTEAGRLKVRWIMMEAPVQHRVVFVHRAINPVDTATRLAAVREATLQIGPQGIEIPIYETGAATPSWSADRIDITSQKFIKAMPDPKLPAATQGGTAGAGGSAK